jgi:hypothetical protein
VNTNQKGVRGLLEVTCDLYKRGFHAFHPVDDYCPVDLIALVDSKPLRFQVKYREKSTGKYHSGKYEIVSTTVICGKHVQIDRGLIDGWAVYLADDDVVVYLPLSWMGTAKTKYFTLESIQGDVGEWFKPLSC